MAMPRDTNEAPGPGRYPMAVPGRRFLIVEYFGAPQVPPWNVVPQRPR